MTREELHRHILINFVTLLICGFWMTHFIETPQPLRSITLGCTAVCSAAMIWIVWKINQPQKGDKESGRVRLTLAPAALAIVLACNEMRPRVSEVSVTYTGTMKSMGALVEVVRWQR